MMNGHCMSMLNYILTFLSLLWYKGHLILELEGPWPKVFTHNDVIRGEAGDGPSSLYIRPWKHKGWKKFKWTKNPHSVLLGILSIAKLHFYFSRYGFWMIFKGPQIFMIRTLGLYVKQPLVPLVLQRHLLDNLLVWVLGTSNLTHLYGIWSKEV